jgi:hypothetical protein
LVHFFPFLYVAPKKSGNPATDVQFVPEWQGPADGVLVEAVEGGQSGGEGHDEAAVDEQ